MPTKSNLPLIEGYAVTKEMPDHQRNLVWLCSFLEPDERALVMAVLVDGQPIRLAAQLMGQPYMTVRSRVNKLQRQLASRKCLAAARLIPHLSPSDAAIARLHFCSGQSCRCIGKKLGITLHALRRRFDRIAVRIDTVAQVCRELQAPIETFPAPAPAPAPVLRRSREHRGRAFISYPPPAAQCI